MSNKITKIRAYTIWNDEAELKWLEEMASQGYRLVKVWGGIFYRFEQTEPKSVHYCHGFRQVKRGDKDNFLQLYADAGWQHAATHMDWHHYFWSDAENASTMDKETAYRDTARILKYMSLLYLVSALILGGSVVVSVVLIPGFDWLNMKPFLFSAGISALMFFWLSSGRKRQLEKLEKMQSNNKSR